MVNTPIPAAAGSLEAILSGIDLDYLLRIKNRNLYKEKAFIAFCFCTKLSKANVGKINI